MVFRQFAVATLITGAACICAVESGADQAIPLPFPYLLGSAPVVTPPPSVAAPVPVIVPADPSQDKTDWHRLTGDHSN